MNCIPEITDPMGKYWKQPRDIREAEMDDSHILLTISQFNDLLQYDTSIPTGEYDGKCWIRQGWLCWFYDLNEDGAMIDYREILLIED